MADDPLSVLLDTIQGNARAREALRAFEEVAKAEQDTLTRCDRTVQELFDDSEFQKSVAKLHEVLPYLHQYEREDPNDYYYRVHLGEPLERVAFHLQRISKRFEQMGVPFEPVADAATSAKSALLAIDALKGAYDMWRINKSSELASSLKSLMIELVNNRR